MLFMGFPGTFARSKSRLRPMPETKHDIGSVDLETKPQIDRL
jgi:hypothetical protein